jgi:hypothetical protein
MQKCNTHSAFALKNTLQQDMQTTEAFCIRIPPRGKTALPLSVEAKFSSSFLFLPPPFGGPLLLAFPCAAAWSTGAVPLLTSGKLDTFPCTAARRAGAPPSPTRRSGTQVRPLSELRPPHRAPVHLHGRDQTRTKRGRIWPMAIWPWRRRIWWLPPACGANWDADARADLRLLALELGKKAGVEGGAVRARRPLPRALLRWSSSCRLPPSPSRRRSRSSDGRAGRAGTPMRVVASGDAGVRADLCRLLALELEKKGGGTAGSDGGARRAVGGGTSKTPVARGASMICLAKLQCLLETTTIA